MAESLKLYRVHVPHYKLAGENALLECDFDLGNARLYAVKWYKDNEGLLVVDGMDLLHTYIVVPIVMFGKWLKLIFYALYFSTEFFRFIPRFKPPIFTHPVDGVNVDVSKELE